MFKSLLEIKNSLLSEQDGSFFYNLLSSCKHFLSHSHSLLLEDCTKAPSILQHVTFLLIEILWMCQESSTLSSIASRLVETGYTPFRFDFSGNG